MSQWHTQMGGGGGKATNNCNSHLNGSNMYVFYYHWPILLTSNMLSLPSVHFLNSSIWYVPVKQAENSANSCCRKAQVCTQQNAVRSVRVWTNESFKLWGYSSNHHIIYNTVRHSTAYVTAKDTWSDMVRNVQIVPFVLTSIMYTQHVCSKSFWHNWKLQHSAVSN
jgi:hypothetical protein